MNLNVIVTPHADGYRAWTGGLPDLTADGPTADAAVAALRTVLLARPPRFEVRTIHLPDPPPLSELAPDPYREADFEALRESIAEIRSETNTVPDDE